MPVTIWAAMRPGSAAIPVARAAMSSDRSVMIVAPTQMRMLVRSPAGLPESSRSSPIAPPSAVAIRSLVSRSSRRASVSEASVSMGRSC
jgi:hypothetical protein